LYRVLLTNLTLAQTTDRGEKKISIVMLLKDLKELSPKNQGNN